MHRHMWACSCGTETECEPEDQKAGAVFQCPGCKTVWGGVRRRDGWGPVWVRISDSDVQFHRLLEEPEVEEI